MKRKRKKSIIWRLLLIGVSVYMIVTLAGLCASLNESRVQLAELEAEKAAKQVEIDDLKKLLDSGSRDKLIEKAARERLGYVYTDEEIY
ncbi:MAG: septum formation initiator family protein, partial [Oscillospiraceae bacterium]|nr:septum formation initiator family protein [Oscillospiraceae bacterium]